jgi:hypothetical protein
MLGDISTRLFLFQAALFAEIQATCSDAYVAKAFALNLSWTNPGTNPGTNPSTFTSNVKKVWLG